MPIVTIKAWEEALDDDRAGQLISALTDAVGEVLGSEVKQYTSVLVEGVPQRCWGVAGSPSKPLDS